MVVKPSDFEILSPTKVRHTATGAVFTTYTYAEPHDAGSSMTVSAGRAGEGNLPMLDELKPVAWQLFQEQAKKADK